MGHHSACTDPKHHVHDSDAFVHEVERACEARGLNLTPIRANALRLIADAGRPVKAYELLDLMKLTRRAQNVLTRVMKPDGFNIGVNLGRVAGAGIAEHLHIHIVPRWNGDTNFMPVLAGATVVPEALTDLAAKLRAAFSEG